MLEQQKKWHLLNLFILWMAINVDGGNLFQKKGESAAQDIFNKEQQYIQKVATGVRHYKNGLQ